MRIHWLSSKHSVVVEGTTSSKSSVARTVVRRPWRVCRIVGLSRRRGLDELRVECSRLGYMKELRKEMMGRRTVRIVMTELMGRER
jgi:hypothetical protein